MTQATILTRAAVLALALAALPATAQAQQRAPTGERAQEAVQAAGDADRVSLRGTVRAATGDAFQLDYGARTITVEMDGLASYDPQLFAIGDRVTVSGEIDDGFFERKTVKAHSVYLDSIETYFYGDAAGEQGGPYAGPLALYDRDGDWVSITGTVASTAAEGIAVTSGGARIEVATDEIERDLDLAIGDRVSVYGRMSDGEDAAGRAIEARSVTVLRKG